MEKEVKELLETIVSCDYDMTLIYKIKIKAAKLLDEDFKKEVRKLWRYIFKNDYAPDYAKEKRATYKNINKLEFIYEIRGYGDIENFVYEHWEQIDDILTIIHEYIAEIEKEKSENE